MSARLLMIALDGADGRLLDQYSADGSLPHLAELRTRGRTQRLSAPIGVTDDAIWASFQYAVNVGEHGRYHFYFPGCDGRMRKAHWLENEYQTFWEELSNQGMRVGIIDIPKCNNPRPINGIHLADWLVHGRYFPKPRSQPPALASDVLTRFGTAPPSQCGYLQHALTDCEVGELERNLHQGVSLKRAAGLHYLTAGGWDLFAIGFKEAHCGSHAFWDFDADHPAHDPERKTRLGDPLKSILRNIDEAIGELVAAAGPDAEVLVFSPTNIEPNGTLFHLMPAIIERLNAQLAAANSRSVDQSLGGSGIPAKLPQSCWQCAILPYNENCAALRVTRMDDSAASAASLAEPPDVLTLQFCEDRLRSLRDADSGVYVISSITRPASELAGNRARSLPDLLVHYASGLFPRAVTSATLGRFQGNCPPMRPGNHSAGGFAIGAGKFIDEAMAGIQTIADLGSLAKAVLNRANGTQP